ncbi:MAG: protein translocase subunit SecF [Gemmatimonadetes bacterium]|nr:protein translocase subunit SecF [Gemmatimonadota bacterium]
MRLFGNANFQFIEVRKKAYLGSAIALLLSIGMAIFWKATRGDYLNWSVDFLGGTLVQVHFDQPVPIGDLRQVVEPLIPGTEITKFGAENEFLIRAPQFSRDAAQVAGRVTQGLAQRFGPQAFRVVRTEAVGPKVGGELRTKGVLAVLFSFLATLIYLAFRFEWRFGLAATLATFHDILITLGFISAFRIEVSLPTVAAVLTIVGYSLNDTVIIFDRVRENLKRIGRRESFIKILDLSINETLPRTILTVSTTLATLYALFFLGGEMLRTFAEILIVGIMTGTYSSIFVASPLLLEIHKRWGDAKPSGRSRGTSQTAAARA